MGLLPVNDFGALACDAMAIHGHWAQAKSALPLLPKYEGCDMVQTIRKG
jgi:hypothetical protein